MPHYYTQYVLVNTYMEYWFGTRRSGRHLRVLTLATAAGDGGGAVGMHASNDDIGMPLRGNGGTSSPIDFLPTDRPTDRQRFIIIMSSSILNMIFCPTCFSLLSSRPFLSLAPSPQFLAGRFAPHFSLFFLFRPPAPSQSPPGLPLDAGGGLL